LPSIARDTHSTQTQLTWVIDAYALIFAALLLLGGAIGDRYGRRRALIVGLVIFGAGSLAAMTATNANVLIAMRGVLGLGAALVMPATLSTLTSTFPAEEKGRAIGLWAGVAGASAILGLLSSGLLLEQWSWRSVFVLNVVLAAAAVAGTLYAVPESADPDAPKLDVVGAMITVVGLGALVYSIIEAPDVGWASMRTLAGFAIGLVVLGCFIGWELTRSNPLLDPRLFRHRGFASGTVSISLQFFAFFGFLFMVLQYLQLVRGDSPLVAALSLIPMALAMMPCARAAPRLADRAGSRMVCVTGLVLIAGALVVLSQLSTHSPYWLLLGGVLPLGAGMGLAMTPATTAITEALPLPKQGIGSAMNDLSRELGGAFGIAVLGSILQSTYRSHLPLVGLPRQAADQARSSLALASRLGGAVTRQAQAAFTDGIRSALLCAAGAVVLAAIAVVVLLRPGQTRSSADKQPHHARSEQ
jgi:EmrB/QacA subfamily drug resistance transporter